MAKTPVIGAKAGATPKMAVPKELGVKVKEAVAKAKPAYNRLANLGDFSHPAKRKKG